MEIIKLLLLFAVFALAAMLFRSIRAEKSLALKRLLALLFVAAAIIAVLFPQLLTAVAAFFGVGRGTDFLLYVFIIAVCAFAIAVIRAKARADARVTKLARAVALAEARAARIHRENNSGEQG